MSEVEWRTEDDQWDDGVPSPDSDPTPPHRRRVWIAIALVLLLAGYTIFTQIGNTVSRVTAEEEAAVRATADLLFRAADEADIAVFNALVSARDRNWTAMQQQLLGDGAIFDRPGFGLVALPGNPQIAEVTLAPDLQSAVVAADLGYSAYSGLTTTLTIPIYFRKGERSWLYAAPGAPFWGDLQRYVGSAAVIDFPERDGEPVRRLAPHLNRVVQQLCIDEPALACDAARPQAILFATDPLLLLAPPLVDDGGTLLLPAPSLVGIANDAAGEALLQTAYSQAVVRALLNTALERPCCTRALFADALITAWLARRDLAELPLTPADYGRLLAERRLFSEAEDLGWHALATADLTQIPATDRHAAYALAEFVQHSDPALTLVDQFDALTPPRQTLVNWLRDLYDVRPPTGGLSANWRAINYFDFLNPAPGANLALVRFLAERSAAGQAQPLPQPDANIVVACEQADRLILLEYDWPNGTWQSQATGIEQPIGLEMVGLSGPRDGSALLFLRRDNGTPPRVAMLIRPDGLSAIGDDMTAYLYIDLPHARSDRLLLFSTSVRSDSNDQPWLYELDATSCPDGACQPQALTGLPIWSPEGNYVVLLESEQWLLRHADGALIATLAIDPPGAYGIVWWLDDQRFAWFDMALGIMQASVSDPTPRLAVPRAGLAQALGITDENLPIWINGTATIPDAATQTVILGVFSPLSSRSGMTLLAVNLASGDIRPLTAEPLDGNGISSSNDGRLVAIVGPTEQRSGRATLSLIDIDGNRRDSTLFGGIQDDWIKWSPDGNWLLVWEGGYGQLQSTRGDEAHIIIPPDGAFCSSVGWLQR